VVGRLTITFLQIYFWVCFKRIFRITQHLAKLRGKVYCLNCPVCRGTVLLKNEKKLTSHDVYQAGTQHHVTINTPQ